MKPFSWKLTDINAGEFVALVVVAIEQAIGTNIFFVIK